MLSRTPPPRPLRPLLRFARRLPSTLLVLAGGLLSSAAHADERMNVLFVLTEDQSTQMSFLETPGLETPHMDSIARRGIYFDQHHTNYPVCSPSKANILTGTYGHTSGLIANTHNFFVPAEQLKPAQRNNPVYQRVSIRGELQTLTEILDEAGYHTAVSGKLHLSPNEKFPYDEWFKENNKVRTAKFLANAEAAGRPFFFFANIQAPHRPFRNSDVEAIGVDPADVSLPAFLPDTPINRQDYAEYLDYVEVADEQLGRVLAAVEEAGEMDNTLVIFTSDHGFAYHRGKLTLYQSGLNVPLAFAGPGVPEGRRTSERVSGVDMMPTLLELLELPVPSQVQGRSFAGVVRGDEGATGSEFVFAEIIHSGQQRDDGMQERSAYDGRFKLIYRENADQPREVNSDLKFWAFPLPNGQKLPWRNRVYREIVSRKAEFPEAFDLLAKFDPQSHGVSLPTFELYDTHADPDEVLNLADDAAHAETLRRMKDAMLGWLDGTGDRFTERSALR